MILKRTQNTTIEDTSIRPILDENGNPINDNQLIHMVCDLADKALAENRTLDYISPNFITACYVMRDELDAGMPIEAVKSRHIQQDVPIDMLKMNPELIKESRR